MTASPGKIAVLYLICACDIGKGAYLEISESGNTILIVFIFFTRHANSSDDIDAFPTRVSSSQSRASV
jgi:hypothetical protein